jgi:hypothetical protein
MDATTTITIQVIGTPEYMAPEQVAGDPVSPATDIFAWGATMVFAATGRPPFGQDNVPAVFQRVLTQAPDLGNLPEPLRAIVTFCLAKSPADRPTTEELLDGVLHGRIRRKDAPRVTNTATPVSWRPGRSLWSPVDFAGGFVGLVFTIDALFSAGRRSAAVLFGLFTALFILSAFKYLRYPLNVRQAHVEVHDAGITATLDGRVVQWDWDDIQRVAVRPIGSIFRHSRPRILGLWVVQVRGSRLDRITSWQLYPVSDMLRHGRWRLLLPLGRRGDSHIPLLADALSQYGRERWIPYR